MILCLYFVAFLGLLLFDWKQLSGRSPKERRIYLCFMAAAAAAGVALGAAPFDFGIIG